MEQQTLSNPFSLEGVGIHTGSPSRVTVNPAEPDAGRIFLVNGTVIPARAQYVVDTTRCTTLGRDGVRVSTVEHLLSALAGCGVDNCVIEVDGPEIPILDGSALPFVDAIQSVGIEVQGRPAHFVRLRDEVVVSGNGSELRAAPADDLYLEVRTEFDEWPEGAAAIVTEGRDGVPIGYRANIAPARTFAFRREVEMLIAAGLAKGGSLGNALIITPPDGFSSALRVASEWCAHKVIDVIGDLALLDARLAIRLHALRPGHRINISLAQSISAQLGDQTP
jgi:UDP-3-O-[3-hydroxymyristoyl] N-acetylglucosamine deacetylase